MSGKDALNKNNDMMNSSTHKELRVMHKHTHRKTAYVLVSSKNQ